MQAAAATAIAGDPAIIRKLILGQIKQIGHQIGEGRRMKLGKPRKQQLKAYELRLEFRTLFIEQSRLREQLSRIHSRET